MVEDLRELLEPEAYSERVDHWTLEKQAHLSAAISLKRIADVLTGAEPLPAFMASVNAYGENFTDAIQNSHERGLRGISTHR